MKVARSIVAVAALATSLIVLPASAQQTTPCEWGRVTALRANWRDVTVLAQDDVWFSATVEHTNEDGDTLGYSARLVHWDGSAASEADLPDLPLWVPGLRVDMSFAAVSPNDIWALGGADVLHFDGAEWSRVRFPTHGAAFGFTGVSALSANDVWAVGVVTEPDDSVRPLVAHWNGDRWRNVRAPAGVSRLWDVAAISAHKIWAVGDDGLDAVIVERLGSRWTEALRARGVRTQKDFVSVSSVGWAVGSTHSGELNPVVARRVGGSWTKLPQRQFPPNAWATDVTGDRSDRVWMVGSIFAPGTPHRAPFIQRWNGERWRKVVLPERYPYTGLWAADSLDREVWAAGPPLVLHRSC